MENIEEELQVWKRIALSHAHILSACIKTIIELVPSPDDQQAMVNHTRGKLLANPTQLSTEAMTDLMQIYKGSVSGIINTD